MLNYSTICNYTEDMLMPICFRTVSVDNIDILQSFFNRYPSKSCDFSVGGVLIWRDMFDYQLSIYEESLLIRGYLDDKDLYLFYAPVGNISLDKYINLLKEYCYEKSIKGILILPEESPVEFDTENENQLSEYLPEYREYLYPIEKFCDFPGKKMEKKRNHLHYFQHNYFPFSIEIISSLIIPELIKFTLEFDILHSENPQADYECHQIIEVLKNYDSYPFEGLAIRKEGEIIGYSFGEKIGNTFIIHAEKGNTFFRGIYQEISSEMAKFILSKYSDVRYLNREDDMGDESLKQSKMSYHPTLFINKRIIHL